MLQAYTSKGTEFDLASWKKDEPLPPSVVWLDLVNPSQEEEHKAESCLGVDLPTHDDLKDIEPSSRLYTENGTIYMTASLAWRIETGLAQITDVGFVIADDRLVTIRYAEPKAFKIFRDAGPRIGGFGDSGLAALTKLLETIIDRTAEILEYTSARIDGLSERIFQRDVERRNAHQAEKDLQSHLGEIAHFQRLTAKTRESLMSLGRVVSFLSSMPAVANDKELKERCASISRDIQSLGEHANFISANITFHLDATLGLINLEQNKIIKILSIAAVVLLPPTFIGSVYGMNFKDIPELSWSFGYAYAIGVMILVSVVPFLWFRKKGWF
jgi:magnesium transporter